MNKQEIIDYVLETPGNTNKNILSQMLDELAEGGGGGGTSPLGSVTFINNSDIHIGVAGVVRGDDGVIQSRSVEIESGESGEVFLVPAYGSTIESVKYVSDYVSIQMNQVIDTDKFNLTGSNATIKKIGKDGYTKGVFHVYAPVETVLTFTAISET